MGIKQQNTISVDIGQHSLNMVYGNGNGQITKAASVRIPDGVINNMRLTSPDMLTATLQEAKSKGKISGRNCVLCIGGREVIIRYFSFPKMSDFHLYENVVSELSPYLPFSADNYTIDFSIKDVIQEGNNTEYSIMVVAVHNEVLLPYVSAFKKAGLKLTRVDIRDNCYEKLIQAITAKKMRNLNNFGIIDIGASTTTISTYSEGKFFINNNLSIGGNHFTDSIAELYGIDHVRAEEKKIEVCNQSYSQQDKEVIEIMNTFFEKIVSDAARVFDFFKSRNNQENIDEIFLCGGSSVIAGMAAYIESSSDITTTEIRDVIKVLFNCKNIDQLNLELFGAAVGGTYREVD